MITKKCLILLLNIIFAMGVYTTAVPLNVPNIFTWLRQKFASKTVSRITPAKDVEITLEEPMAPVIHTKRQVLFENNIPQFFEALKGDPDYADVPSLIDQTIMVNGKAIMPGTGADIPIEDDKGVVTIKLHKGFAKLIYAMEQGVLRGILIKLLKFIDPCIQWQYSVTFTLNKDIDFVQLSDLVLAAYNKSLDQNAVNHRFKWILVVDLSLNETVDL